MNGFCCQSGHLWDALVRQLPFRVYCVILHHEVSVRITLLCGVVANTYCHTLRKYYKKFQFTTLHKSQEDIFQKVLKKTLIYVISLTSQLSYAFEICLHSIQFFRASFVCIIRSKIHVMRWNLYQEHTGKEKQTIIQSSYFKRIKFIFYFGGNKDGHVG